MEELSALLTSPAGTFFSQLTLLLAVFGAIIVTIGRQDDGSNTPRRMLAGFTILLVMRILMSGSALAVSAVGLDPSLNAWVEKGLTTASWSVLTWLWAAPARSRGMDGSAGLLAALALAMTPLTVLLQSGAGPALNLVSLWHGFALLIIIGGLTALAMKRPQLWGYGAVLLSVLLIGEVAAWAASGNEPSLGLLRLAQITAFPILLTLPQRINLIEPAPPTPLPVVRPAPERKRVNLPPGMYGKFLTLATETELLQLCRGITETVSYALVADICLVVSRPTQLDEIIIYCGYDQVLEQEIMGAQIAARHLPMIASAIQKHAPLRLPASSASSDLKFLSSSLHLPKSGHLLVAPLRTRADIGVGALILLTPYSARTWTQDDQSYLMLAAEKVGVLLDQSQAASEIHEELRTLRDKLDAAASFELHEPVNGDAVRGNQDTDLEQAAYTIQALEAELSEIKETNRQLLEELSEQQWQQTVEHLQAENIQLQLTVQELEQERDLSLSKADSYQNAQKESLRLIEQLHEENERMRHEFENASSASASSTNGKVDGGGRSHLENELKEALREIAHLRNLNGEAEIRVLELQNLASANEETSRQWEMIIALAEEMRQPMSSILGYSDFLLTESVGLLGTLQRKFLERVKTSTNRMSAMVENLIHIAAAESGRLKLNISEVNLSTVIDAAIAASSVQMREKTISLLVNIPDNLPTIEGDREAIRLTLIHLLHNASAATPVQGEITIEILLDHDAGEDDYIQIFVSDTGGGIAPEDLPRVFDRRLKSRDSLIPGLGVTSTGLSIAKTLVEAHGGRIWVENRFEGGATFCILLPLKQDVSASLFGDRSF